MVDRAREPDGQPGGGRFAETARPEATGVHLDRPAPRLDPAVAHHIDGRTMLGLLPHVSQQHLSTIRLELARHIQTRYGRASFATWQDAWNDMTGATPVRDGTLRLRNVTCSQCHGKGFDVRHPGTNLARTGNASICGECRGRRRTTVTVRVRFAHPAVDPS